MFGAPGATEHLPKLTVALEYTVLPPKAVSFLSTQMKTVMDLSGTGHPLEQRCIVERIVILKSCF